MIGIAGQFNYITIKGLESTIGKLDAGKDEYF
jgi:hypothetical protein